ncbi:MAG: DNA repair protein RecN [Planctomycetes bacterium]|nr:DNA repair protein RecN [Planctomycetota bacterium]
MLQSFHVRDLALIEHAELALAPGLNVLSGETGGGKSLLVRALELLRGEKAQAGLVRHQAPELRVDGEFVLQAGERAAAVAALVREVAGVEIGEEPLVLTRIVDAEGRSRARIQGRPAPLHALRALGEWLLEIHGQGDARSLMRPEIQAEMLDSFGRCAPARAAFAEGLARARALAAELRSVSGAEAERRDRAEFLRFRVQELEQLGLQPGELARLEDEHRVLAHLDRLRELLAASLADLQDGEANAADALGRAARALGDAAQIDGRLRGASESVAEAVERVAEAARAAQSGLGRLDLDPERLGAVEARLAAVREALRRHGPGEAELRAALTAMRAELGRLESPERSAETLATRLREATGEVARLGRALLRGRAKAAPAFAAAIQGELQGLGMAQTRIRVDLDAEVAEAGLLERATAHGPGPVELMVQINPGEPFQKLRDTASGGEMARLVLAIKKCLADQDRVPMLVFDEVDAEIGGRLGLAVGRKLREVARNHQVVIVTHLPQVAAFAQAHFRVAKAVRDGRTLSAVERLQGAAIERELAAMAAGEGADAASLAEARRLVGKARREEA